MEYQTWSTFLLYNLPSNLYSHLILYSPIYILGFKFATYQNPKTSVNWASIMAEILMKHYFLKQIGENSMHFRALRIKNLYTFCDNCKLGDKKYCARIDITGTIYTIDVIPRDNFRLKQKRFFLLSCHKLYLFQSSHFRY